MENEPTDQASFSSLRRWGVGLNVVLTIAAVLVLVAMVNYLAIRHFRLAQEQAGDDLVRHNFNHPDFFGGEAFNAELFRPDAQVHRAARLRGHGRGSGKIFSVLRD